MYCGVVRQLQAANRDNAARIRIAGISRLCGHPRRHINDNHLPLSQIADGASDSGAIARNARHLSASIDAAARGVADSDHIEQTSIHPNGECAVAG